MITVTITEKGGKASSKQFDKPEITIGRIQGNDIVLPKSNISKRHARIVQNGASYVIIDSKSTNGTYINGKRIDAPYDLRAGDKIFVGDFTIELEMEEEEERAPDESSAPAPVPQREDRSNGREPGRRAEPEAKRRGQEDVLDDDEWDASPSLENDWADDWDNSKSGARSEDEERSRKAPGPPPPKPAQRAPDREDRVVDTRQLAPEARSAAPAPAAARERHEPRREEPRREEPRRDETRHEPREARREERPARPPAKSEPAPSRAARAPRDASKAREMNEEVSTALRTVHDRLLRSLDLRRMGVEKMGDDELRTRTRSSVEEIVQAMAAKGELPKQVEPRALIDDVLDEALGLGPLEDLLADDDVTEILVNGSSRIYVERGGRLERTDRVFSSEQAVLGVIERIVAPLGRRIDESSPMVDARLKDGSRVNAIIPPLALRGPTLTIRKFTRDPLLIDDLVAYGTLTADMAAFLETCVKARKNMLISGGTGSGKTTTLNVLSSFIPEAERIITIEDAAELKLDQEHVVSLEARPPNIEGRGAVTIRDLVRNALRMRPDRIVVGECRGGEALDMLQAMNTGHEGSLTTVHANGPRDALSRLETMVLMSGMELPIRAIRDQICNAIDVIVQQQRFSDGSRRITHISEVTGMEGDVITMQDIFVFDQTGFDADGRVQGTYEATGFVPRFYEDLKARGVAVDFSIFQR